MPVPSIWLLGAYLTAFAIQAQGQFLSDGQISASQCAAASSDRGSGTFPLSVQYLTLNYGDTLPLELYHYHDSRNKKWSLQCLQISEFGPLGLPSYLEETCANSAPIFELCYATSFTTFDCVDISSYGTIPVQDYRFAGRDERITFYKLRWKPSTASTLSTCYPRTLTVLIDTGLIEPEKNSIAAYVVVAVIGFVMVVIGVAVLIYLLHRRMNTFRLRGEALGGQKDQVTEPYGPGDEDETTKAKLEEQQRIASMHASPSYARRTEYEVEPGVFVPRRIELYGDLSHQSQLEQRYAVPTEADKATDISQAIANAPDGSVVVAAAKGHTYAMAPIFHDKEQMMIVQAPSIERDEGEAINEGTSFPGSLIVKESKTKPHRRGKDLTTISEKQGPTHHPQPNPDVTLTLVPPTISGAPSQLVYGPLYGDVRPYNPQGGPQSAIIEVEAGGPLKSIVSAPLRKPWHEQLRGEQFQHGGVASPYRDPLAASILSAMHSRVAYRDPFNNAFQEVEEEEEEVAFASPYNNSAWRNRPPPTEGPSLSPIGNRYQNY